MDLITVNDGPTSASEGIAISDLSAVVEFDVADTADNVLSEMVGTGSSVFDEANSVAVTSGDVTVDEAVAIQSISAYDGANSDYDITDTAANILSSTDAILDKAGVDVVTVSDGPVSASEGETLTDYSANISFDIRDTADAIAAEVVGTGNANELDDANSVFVSGGDVTVDEASAIQAISGYSSVSSNYDITDDAENIKNRISLHTQVSGDVTATDVSSKEDALSLKNDGNVDNFTLDASLTGAASITGATVDEALSLLQSTSGATNGLTDESVISIVDTVSNLDTHIFDLTDSAILGDVHEVHATVSNIDDAESFVSGTMQSGASFYSSDLPAQVDKFSIDTSVLSSEANFMGLTVSQALSVLKAANASQIPNISISDTYANLTAADASTVNAGLGSSSIPSILENPYVVYNGTSVSFTFKDVHVNDVTLSEAIDLNTNYPNVNFSYSLDDGTNGANQFTSANLTNATIAEAEAFVHATNFPGSSQLTIQDTATSILNSDGFAIFASGDVTATGASHAQAVQLDVMADVDTIKYAPGTSFSNLSIEEASVVVGNKAETSGVDSFSISDNFSALASNISLVVNAPNGYEISNYDVTKPTVSVP